MWPKRGIGRRKGKCVEAEGEEEGGGEGKERREGERKVKIDKEIERLVDIGR